ncbi:MAG: response regulator transcription factor [Ruminococcaceae bacterium]|nr:response regulator transcription factor [Oscillospiraceae bacterium]
MAKLLIVDDEINIRNLIVKYAKYENYETLEAGDGMTAVCICRDEKPDLVIMDIMMPEMDGFTASREIKRFSDVPIILLSARGEEYDRINGFEIGVDDYVIKPFSPKELMLRVGVILRRVERARQPAAEKSDIFKLDQLEVNFISRIIKIDGKRIDMSPKEYDLFFYMIRNANIALTREKLICEVWGCDFYGDDRTLDTHIKLLRRSLGDYGKYIVTLRGVGYRFETSVQ